jgi:asparagine synthase (glutamine-hydrolysing)
LHEAPPAAPEPAPPGAAATLSWSGPGSALHASTDIHPVTLHHEELHAACLMGRAYFRDAEYAALARERGMGHALLAAWRKLGDAVPEHLGGSFALALLSPRGCLLAIDRMGIHGMAYARVGAGLVFSTSAREVAGHLGAKLNPQGIFHYFYFNEVPSPGSIFEGVAKLGPGQRLTLRDGRMEVRDYWVLAHDESRSPDFETEKKRFHDIFRQSVARALDDAPTGYFLSGGTDSSSVVGMAAQITGQATDTYSIGFPADGFDEMEYARLAAARYGCNPHEYYLAPDDVLEAIPLIAAAYDEPFANESAVPTYFCARMAARDGKRAMLAGDGGDEIFGGNSRYAKQMVFERYARLPAALRQGLIEPLAFRLPAGALPILRRARSYISQANIPLPARLETYNFLTRQPLSELFEPAFLAQVDVDAPEAWQRDIWARARAEHPINRMMHLDLKYTLADNDLRKVTRMCEAAGVEVRYPMLDDDLVAFSGTLPPDWMVRDGYLRWFFKRAQAEMLPREIIDKKKHGFGLPFGVWARDHAGLRERVESAMDRFKSRGILRADYLDRVRAQHLTEHASYYGRMIWMILMLEEWLGTRGL